MSENINSRSGQDSEEVYTGEHSTQTDSMLDDSEIITWEFDEKALFETISHKIYESDEAAIREPIFNGVSAALQASESGYIDNPRVNVYLSNNDGELTLVIRDNGMGVSRNMVEESMAYVGRSQNRYVADLMGKFGFGFLAAFRLVTSTGVFFMHTHSRKTDENFCGVWSNSGFEIDVGNELPQALDDDEYGTRLEFRVKDSISRIEIHNWVDKNAEHARIPIEYQEIGFEDNVTKEYGDYSLKDSYENPEFGYHIENEYFTAWCHLEANNRTFCLDAPIKRSCRVSRFNNDIPKIPYKLDIRFKSENGGIVKGPNKGKTPINDAEYAEIPDDLKNEFIKKSEMDEEDINIPHPTGSRDNLTESMDFWKYIHDKINKMDQKMVNSVKEKLDTISDLTDKELFHLTRNRNLLYNNEISEEKMQKVEVFSSKVRMVDENGDCSNTLTDERAADISVNSDGPVFMGVKIHDQKRKLVQDVYDNCTIVKVNGSNQMGISASETYDILGSAFGWRKIKDIDVKSEEFASASEEIKEQLTNTNSSKTNQTVLDRNIKIHYKQHQQNDRKTITRTVEEILDGNIFEMNITVGDKLIIFPTTSEYAISDHYDLINETYCVAKATKKATKKLNESENVIIYDDLLDEIHNMAVMTSEGEYLGSELTSSDKNVVFFETSEENMAEMQNNPEFMMASKKAICTNFCNWQPHVYRDVNMDIENSIFIPITQKKYDMLSICDDTIVLQKLGQKLTHYHLKAYYELENWRDSSKFETMIKTLSRTDVPNVLVETWIAAHESGLDIEKVER